MGLRDRAILETLYSAGLRVSELVGLNDGDVDLPQGVLRVRGKGRKERLAPLGSYAMRALQAWLKVRTLAPGEPQGREAPVFTNRFGTRLTTRSVGRMLEKYLARDGPRPAAPAPTRCGTASPRTCSTAAPTSAACRSSGPQEPGDDANLHARQHRQPAGRVREGPSRGRDETSRRGTRKRTKSDAQESLQHFAGLSLSRTRRAFVRLVFSAV